MAIWLKSHDKGTTIDIYVQPGSSRNEICGEHGGRLKIKITAPAREGEANEALIEFLSEVFKIPKKIIFLLKGESSRQKVILVELPHSELISLLTFRPLVLRTS
jgi:uncharacterized protein (TIGR00251 family)